MKKFLVIIILVMTFCLTGCSNGGIKNISYQELEDMIENKETFMLEIIQTGCSACEDFTPRFNTILKENNLTAYSINYTNLSDEDRNSFENIIHINSTPTVIFFDEGVEESVSFRIIGAISDEKIIQKLKTHDYIK